MIEFLRLPSRLRLALLFALLFAPLRAELEFTGIFVTSRQSLFALTDKSSDETAWRRLGQNFAGAELISYNAMEDTLILHQDGATVRLRLKDSKVKTARVEIAGTISLEPAEKLNVIRGTLIFDQENVFPISDDLTCRVVPKLRPDGNILYRAVFEQSDRDGKLAKLSAPGVIARPDQPFEVQIGRLGFSFTPKPLSPP